jgi:putative membrane protein
LGIAYLGSQGDIWDAQKDMFLAGIGSLIAMVLTFFILIYYDSSGFWKEFKDSLKFKKEILGERALNKLKNKK